MALLLPRPLDAIMDKQKNYTIVALAHQFRGGFISELERYVLVSVVGPVNLWFDVRQWGRLVLIKLPLAGPAGCPVQQLAGRGRGGSVLCLPLWAGVVWL